MNQTIPCKCFHKTGNRNKDLIPQLERHIIPFQNFDSFGIDIYCNALELVRAPLYDEAL